MFAPPDISKQFAEKEKKILVFWKGNNIFEKSLDLRKNGKTFRFYDGPPFATGLPHYGHLLAGTIKDVVPRYQTMCGHYVSRRFGWDCHGLPIENIVEKKLGLSGAASIHQLGIDKFNESCRENVLTYANQWKGVVERMGRWVDFDRAYKTMDVSYMESVWWVLKELYSKNLVYKGYKVMPYSWKLGTPLSNFEASENYQDVDDPSITISFVSKEDEQVAYLAWTTTPWTLVSNLALSVNPSMTYVKVELLNVDHSVKSWLNPKTRFLIVAKSRLEFSFSDLGEGSYRIVEEFLGEDLIGRQYRPLFDFFSSQKGAFKLLAADFVSDSDGTGIVHTAPAFGEDDFEVCQNQDIELVCPINSNGYFDSSVGEFSGLHYLDGNKPILLALKQKGNVLWQKTIRHRYPYCWRSDTPLIYRACQTWFVKVKAIKESLIKNNQSIHWVPGHIKNGRFGKWIENARDWAISRNRFWGTPIPIWESEDGDRLVIGSIEELEKLSGQKIDDIHRHFVDSIEIHKDGKVYRRIQAVFDCWFESGSMPIAQMHYPFSNKKEFLANYPADFIAEGLDQTRGWFYTLNVLSTALFNQPAFKNVIVNGIILAEDGNKMSKRLQNYPDPMDVMEKYGADALRLYLLKSPVVRGDDLCFSEEDVELVMRQILLPWHSSFNFFLTYASLYNFTPSATSVEDLELTDLDIWIRSRLASLTKEVREAMDSYRLWEAIEPLISFIDDLTNWYIRRCRRRFWSELDTPDRQAAFHTLYKVLVDLCKLAAPFMPFLTEHMYKILSPQEEMSVHLCDYPEFDFSQLNVELQEEMIRVKKVVSMGHALRKMHKIKVRQPLLYADMALGKNESKDAFKKHESLICDELNVKSLRFIDDASSFLKGIYKLNFKKVGKRLGPLMKSAKQWVEIKMTSDDWIYLEEKGHLSIDGIDFEKGDILQEYHVKDGVVAQYQDGVSLALCTELTSQLLLEGQARELINKINTRRKSEALNISDRIQLQVYLDSDSSSFENLWQSYGEEISNETLITKLIMLSGDEKAKYSLEPIELNGLSLYFGLVKVDLEEK